jgi:hypothetical protein
MFMFAVNSAWTVHFVSQSDWPFVVFNSLLAIYWAREWIKYE